MVRRRGAIPNPAGKAPTDPVIFILRCVSSGSNLGAIDDRDATRLCGAQWVATRRSSHPAPSSGRGIHPPKWTSGSKRSRQHRAFRSLPDLLRATSHSWAFLRVSRSHRRAWVTRAWTLPSDIRRRNLRSPADCQFYNFRKTMMRPYSFFASPSRCAYRQPPNFGNCAQWIGFRANLSVFSRLFSQNCAKTATFSEAQSSKN